MMDFKEYHLLLELFRAQILIHFNLFDQVHLVSLIHLSKVTQESQIRVGLIAFFQQSPQSQPSVRRSLKPAVVPFHIETNSHYLQVCEVVCGVLTEELQKGDQVFEPTS